MEYFETAETFNNVGGLERLKDWLLKRKQAFEGATVTVDGVEITLPQPKGILLLGAPGCGKSLVAKAVAAAWGLPLLRLDIGRIFGSFLGQSEENMRRAIKVAESIAPCVVWLDEVEKAFPKTTGASDAGASLRVMGTFLTWMQEKQKPVFVMSTANDIEQMPPELTRKGRFDEIFYVGLPDEKARREIFNIHTRGLPLRADDLDELASKAKLYSGAEIEQVVKTALFVVPRHRGQESPLFHAVLECMEGVEGRGGFVPLAARRGADGRAVLSKTFKAALSMAVPASDRFEDLEQEEPEHVRDRWGGRF
jgi:SpoVK/Ycf46/Vps4 family AAA+-type ATPase